MAVPDRAVAAHATPRGARWIALAWGFAEAVLFFVIPDVWIGFVALHGLRNGLVAGAWALAGALAGGTLVYLVSQQNQMLVLAAYERLPAIDEMLIHRAVGQLEVSGGPGMVLGGFSGVPYKLYAATAEAAGMEMPAFLAWTMVARGLRFAVFAFVAWMLARWLQPRIGPAKLRLSWLAACVAGYALYWTLMPW